MTWPTRPHQAQQPLRYGCYRATVTAVRDGRAWVTIDRLAPGIVEGGDFGLEVLEFPGTAGIVTGAASGHVHDVEPSTAWLAEGDRVLVMFVEGNRGKPVVIGRFPRP